MDLLDLLYEAKGTFVIKGGRGDYRVDPNSDHSTRHYPDAWTKSVEDAHVFDERSARKFLRRRAQAEVDANRSTKSEFDHTSIRIVPVEVVDGKPQELRPAKKKRFSMFNKKSA